MQDILNSELLSGRIRCELTPERANGHQVITFKQTQFYLQHIDDTMPFK